VGIIKLDDPDKNLLYVAIIGRGGNKKKKKKVPFSVKWGKLLQGKKVTRGVEYPFLKTKVKGSRGARRRRGVIGATRTRTFSGKTDWQLQFYYLRIKVPRSLALQGGEEEGITGVEKRNRIVNS